MATKDRKRAIMDKNNKNSEIFHYFWKRHFHTCDYHMREIPMKGSI